MERGRRLTLTEAGAAGLFFMQRYRLLTIDQFARAAGLHHANVTRQLRVYEQHGLLRHFGNTRLAGHGKTPKVYVLTRKGFELVREESEIPQELLGGFKEMKVEAAWSPHMFHRLRTIDALISVECAIRKRPHITMVKPFLEYCKRKRGDILVGETTDFVAAEETAENKIIPDAAFILENIQSKRRALFFLEMDMATERITSALARGDKFSLHYKFTQYDRYLNSLRYAQKYKDFGDFGYFTMLFVTFGEERVQHIRAEMRDLSSELADW
jgi:Replication-relaxation